MQTASAFAFLIGFLTASAVFTFVVVFFFNRDE